MSLSAGTRLGSYEVVGPLGAGGMGEVYRARDSQLGRDVAIKALPDLVGNDPERVARFQREAQVLAALSHPNIAGIYGIAEGQGAKFLVLEFVAGATLAHQLASGRPMPLDEALPVAHQIIDALEAAHDKGIVHRDLKPANIMVTADGQVKVLDFGLARVVESDPSASTSNSPTLTFAATQVGVILGTAAYMSPEQAKGRIADKRSDVWAFGCVLYEMLTGKRVFDGEDVSDTLAAVLRAEPNWSALPANIPHGIRSVLERCLDRDRKKRIPDFAVIRFLLNDALAPTSPSASTPGAAALPARGSSRRMWLVAIGALAAGIALAAAMFWVRERRRPVPAPPSIVRFSIATPPTQPLGPTPTDKQLTISPSGSHLAYVTGSSTTGGSIVVRAANQLESVTVPGVTGARSPFFSADGKWVGYVYGSLELRKVSVSGGPSVLLGPIVGGPRGASWGPDDTIIFATSEDSTGLQSIPANGGAVTTLTTPAPGEGDHILPSVLPDGRGVLFTILTPGQVGNAQVAVLDRTTKQIKVLLRGASDATYVDPGFLVYAASGSLRAVRFDLARREVVGDPIAVLDNIAILASGVAEYTLSRTGTLVYVPGAVINVVGGGAQRTLIWMDRRGREEPIKAAPARSYFNLRLSPDGTRVALDIRDQESDIWIWDLTRENLMRITFDVAADIFPLWTHDGKHVVFGSARAGNVNVYQQAADGTGSVERLTTATWPQYPMSFSNDGGELLINELKPGRGADVSVLSLQDKSIRSLIETPAAERVAAISPDGRWVVFESDEQSNKSEIYVRPFPEINAGRWQVSTAGGFKPLWAPNGREVFYEDPSGFMMAVPVQLTPQFRAGNPTRLFQTRNVSTLVSARYFDVARDGRFIMIKEPPPPTNASPASALPTFVTVLNWTEDLKAKLGGR